MPKNIEQDLNRLLPETASVSALRRFLIPAASIDSPNHTAELDFKLAMGAASAVILYLNLMTDETNFGQYTLKHHDLSQYMKLDASALRALNLMPNPLKDHGAKNMSLFGLLNRCKTSQGVRLLGSWLKQPLINLHQIRG